MEPEMVSRGTGLERKAVSDVRETGAGGSGGAALWLWVLTGRGRWDSPGGWRQRTGTATSGCLFGYTHLLPNNKMSGTLPQGMTASV